MRDYAYESKARTTLRDIQVKLGTECREDGMKRCEGCKLEYVAWEDCFKECSQCGRCYSDLYVAKSGWEQWRDEGMRWPSFCAPLDCRKWLRCNSRYGAAVCFRYCEEKVMAELLDVVGVPDRGIIGV